MVAPLVIVGGAVAALGGGLLIRKQILAKKGASSASIKALPPQLQTQLATRGPDPSQATINSLAIQQAAGTLDVANLLKGTNGVVFTKVSPQMKGQSIPDSIATQIQTGDTLTVDVDGAGIQVAGIPSGQNMLCLAKGPADMQSRSIPAISIDPRIPDNTTVLTIPIAAITGIEP